MEKSKKNKGGRPSVLTANFVEAFEKVVDEVIYLTDEELVIRVNSYLPKNEQIHYNSFKNWKSGSQENNLFYSQFLSLIKKALINQKLNLFEQLQNDDKAWQRWAWIIERKFSEWNIRHISEVDHKSSDRSMSPTAPKTLADWYDKNRSKKKNDAG
jgi:hypothetical protein